MATPPAWKSGSTVTISPLNSCWVVVSSTEPSLTTSDLPIWNFVSSRILVGVALGLARIADRDGAHVRQPQPVRDLDVADEVHLPRVELLALDLDLEERSVVLRRRHQVSMVGIVSWEPRRSANGLSIPLASAILRQRVASP
jgi:hypothetical protein